MSGRWPLGSEVKHSALGGGAMLYDASRVSNFAPAWFDPTYWQSRGELEGIAQGRGATHYFKTAGKSLVLRHYRRGGLVRHLSADKYFWRGEDNTRPFTEWQLTYRLHRAGLPVPAPIACRYVHNGMTYRGDLITERLADGGIAGGVPAQRRTLHSHLDTDRTLCAEISRPRRLSRGSECAQCPVERGDRVPDRFRPLRAAQSGGLLARRQPGAPAAVAREDHLRACRAIGLPKRIGTACSTATASSPANSR